MSGIGSIGQDRIVGIIPARWGSTRFPGKVLEPIAGRPLLEWIVRGCRRSKRVRRWVVAVDDRRVAAVAERCGVEVVFTRAGLKSGSDRVARVAAGMSERWIVNWQGDEWLPHGRPIDLLVEALETSPGLSVATLARPLAKKDAADPNRVKVVLSQSGRALYFSRALIPHEFFGTRPALLHLGAYAFARKTLLAFARWRKTPLEKCESLEQLRLLEHDVPIAVAVCRVRTQGVDTPADARTLARMLVTRSS